MKLPRSLKIDGEKWKVKKVKPSGLDDNYIGRANFPNHFIAVDTTIAPDRQAGVMLHELIHVVSSNRGMGLKEHQVESLANGLFAVIRDNDLDFTKGGKE